MSAIEVKKEKSNGGMVFSRKTPKPSPPNHQKFKELPHPSNALAYPKCTTEHGGIANTSITYVYVISNLQSSYFQPKTNPLYIKGILSPMHFLVPL